MSTDLVKYEAPLVRTGPSVRKAEHAVNVRNALEMRAKGYEYDDIARALGISVETAKQYVKRGIDLVPKEAADDVRTLELKRLDKLLTVYYQKALDGHGPSLDRTLLIMERRARLEGLDSPYDMDWAAIRNQFFQRLREVLPPEDVVRVLQAFVDQRAG